MKVAVFFAAICIFALVMPQAYAEEEEETAVREVRSGKGEWLYNYSLTRGTLYKSDLEVLSLLIATASLFVHNIATEESGVFKPWLWRPFPDVFW